VYYSIECVVYDKLTTNVTWVVGAQDFLPDFESVSSCVSIANIYPRYQPISSAMQKAKKWIADARVCSFATFLLKNKAYLLHLCSRLLILFTVSVYISRFLNLNLRPFHK